MQPDRAAAEKASVHEQFPPGDIKARELCDAHGILLMFDEVQ